MARQGEILLPGERRRKRPWRRRLPAALLAALVLLLLYPHVEGARLPPPPAGRADAVLVLAGGEKRIATGLTLLLRGAAGELHVIGAGRRATAAGVVPGYGGLDEAARKAIHVETWSENTHENAASAKAIVLERGLRSVILVTSSYHVPRAARAVRASLPPSVPLWVVPAGAERRPEWRHLRLYLLESVKYWGFRLLLTFE